MTLNLQTVWPAELLLGEGPLWHAASGRFLFVDVHGMAIHAWNPSSGQRQSWKTPERVGWVIPRADGNGFMAGFHSGFVQLWLEPELRWQAIGSPHANQPDTRMNDAKADCFGRIWAGSMNNRDDSLTHGQLVRLDTDQTFTVVERGIHVANGPAIAADGSWMLHTDSFLKTTYRYTLNADGTVASKSVWRIFTDAEGFPDGMTHDADGNVWIAFWDGACIRQFTPSGELLQTIALPAPRITSMAFGGDDYRTLFVTSARVGLDDETLKKYPLSGSCFAFKLGVAGLAALPFGSKT